MIAPLLLLLAAATAAAAAPRVVDPYADALERYRDGDAESCIGILERAVTAEDATSGYHSLLGWCRLRLDRVESAAAAFSAALELDADSGEAWKGLGVVRTRRGDPLGARTALRRAAELAPGDAETAELLAANLGLPVEERRLRPARDASVPLAVVARARAGSFEVRSGADWTPLFVKGVNLGTALPGTFPAEFPDDEALYLRWFGQIGGLGANVVRLYTLHPPSLYRALREHNRKQPARRLWLIQGVWSELPPGDDYDGAEFTAELHAEIRRVIDAIHGNLELPPLSGRAHGIYDVDVSDDVLALLLGREWEPYSVVAYHERRPGARRFDGRYVRTDEVQPIEAWLASIVDVAVEHETETYRSQRPVSYVSWPTLDPLIHPTETTLAEELRWRGTRGEGLRREVKEYENDRVQVDATLLRATGAFPAGLFATYHAYPYYPEFMILDPGYARARDAEGISRYLGYLQGLRSHHGGQPVLIAELGVPSSRGNAHLHPQGQHHGGLDERAQGEIDARLMRNVHQAGLAGGIVFSWMDEWFKRNWLVSDYESPPDRNPLWLNVQDPEQNFGLIAARPGASGPAVVLDGDAEDWSGVAPIYEQEVAAGIRSLRVTHDEAYVYLAVELASSDAGKEVWVGIDTYDSARGDRRFPPPADRTIPIGMEFLVRFAGEASSITVARSYERFAQRYRRPQRSEPSELGDFVEIRVETNRDRFSRDGTHHPAKGYSRSPLRYGTTDPGSASYDSLADWFSAPGSNLIEARIPWGLLNITDPSSHRVIHERARTAGVVETTATEGFRFHLLALDDSGIADSLPHAPRTPGDYPLFVWPGWEVPSYRLEPKLSYWILRQTFNDLP